MRKTLINSIGIKFQDILRIRVGSFEYNKRMLLLIGFFQRNK